MAVMGLNEYRATLQARIDAELEARLGEWFEDLPPAQLGWLKGIVAEGKRLRGCLTCLVAEALGARLERALPLATAIEIVQAASLVHDDFVDGDALRRGRAAAWTWLTPRHAVLAADVMFATALERMAALGPREAATLARAIASMARGAFQEMLDAHSSYRRIIQWKTGSLFAAAARLGALAADAEPRLLEAAYEYGMCTGEAYQMADDLADEPATLPRMRQAMQDDIGALLAQAAAALAPFPDNECTRMLREAPRPLAR
jgi:geranylgeranyl pyrophosphate synthase